MDFFSKEQRLSIFSFFLFLVRLTGVINFVLALVSVWAAYLPKKNEDSVGENIASGDSDGLGSM